MEKVIIYTKNKNGYAKIRNNQLIIEIPIFLKRNKNFINQLIKKGEELIDKHNKYNQLQVFNENNLMIFGEEIKKEEIGNYSIKSLKGILLDYITPIANEYSKKIGLGYKSIRIGKAKTKRGSCSYDQKLMFNINLIHLPTKYIKYVIIHEICHLKHKNHSKNFWLEVEGFLPNYKEIRKELKNIIICNDNYEI